MDLSGPSIDVKLKEKKKKEKIGGEKRPRDKVKT
jgi:hypothetical protein